MQAVVYPTSGKLDVASLPVPEPAPGTVLIRIASCGICHTDIEVLHGRYGSSAFPLVPGHEYSGVVERVGEAVETVSVGERVVVDPNLSCGRCRACLRGLRNLRENLQAHGVTTNGGFAEYSVVGASSVHPIGDMPFNLAALAEPLACVLNGVGRIETEGAANALVFGAGPIGLLLALALRDAGVPDVSVVDIDESRLPFVETLGLNPIASASGELSSLARAVDIVADATGVPNVVEGLPSNTWRTARACCCSASALPTAAFAFPRSTSSADRSASPGRIRSTTTFRRPWRYCGAPARRWAGSSRTSSRSPRSSPS